MLGQSAEILRIERFIRKAAPSKSNVLILGESGVGKELVARAIHAHSACSHGPFLAINCAAIPGDLMESEFFGHERGAYTGAFTQQKGKIELAHGGTLFLDEIGELSLSLQAKLLRVLQDGSFYRLGGLKEIEVEVRIVAATNRDLQSEVDEGRFREDLFYRLNVLDIRIAPLRERKEDIPELARHFVKEFAGKAHRTIRGITDAAMDVLVNYHWPGNIRQLQNVLERTVVMGSGDQVVETDLPAYLFAAETGARNFHELVDDFKHYVITDAIHLTGGSRKKACVTLGLDQKYMNRTLLNLTRKKGFRKLTR